MIDVKKENEQNLKDVRQIGTPSEEDKIYMEDAVYRRIHEDDYAPKRIFVLMGHTECRENRYVTFAEAAIPVQDIEFDQNVPRFSRRVWNDIYQEIRRAYENLIIVGWAMDIKGFVPRMTPELEAVHREHFGGAHQVLFLMDSAENEEFFYINKGNCLQQNAGFFIYYSAESQKPQEAEVTVEVPQEMEALAKEGDPLHMPRYREALKQQKEKHGEHRFSSYAMMAAILLLIGIVGVGVYQDRIKLSSLEKVVSTMGGNIDKLSESSSTEVLELIPVNELPSGEIQKIEKPKPESGTGTLEETGTEKGTDDNSAKETAAGTGKKDDAGSQTADADGDESAGESTAGDSEADDKNGQANGGASEPTVETAPNYYTVQKGDTLTAIAKRYYGSAAYIRELAEANGLENADDIREGQKLLLP